jgi:2-methylcitrate dehydratase PrpD
MSDTRAIVYVRHRVEGRGSRESARLAGYAHGVPTAKALGLWDAYQRVRGHHPSDLAHIPARLEEMRQKVRELSYLCEALELM